MTTNHHTPHDTVSPFDATGTNLNSPLSELDTAITTNASNIATNSTNITTNATNIANNAGGASATDALLKAWAISGAWWHTAQPTYDTTYTSLVASVAIEWPDGSAGTYTAVTINEAWEETISFTVSHTDSGKTVSISKDARDEDGLETSGVTVSVS